MSKTPEGQIKKSILEFLELYAKKAPFLFWNQESVGIFDAKKGIYRKKKSRFQKNGIADIILVKNYYDLPCIIFLEVKAPGGKQSDDQKEFEKEVQSVNGFYFIVKSIDDVIVCLENVRKVVESKIDRVAASRVSHAVPSIPCS